MGNDLRAEGQTVTKDLQLVMRDLQRVAKDMGQTNDPLKLTKVLLQMTKDILSWPKVWSWPNISPSGHRSCGVGDRGLLGEAEYLLGVVKGILEVAKCLQLLTGKLLDCASLT